MSIINKALSRIVKFRCSEDLIGEMDSFSVRMTDKTKKKVSRAQSIRWILESFFGISSFKLEESDYPGKATSLVGPGKGYGRTA